MTLWKLLGHYYGQYRIYSSDSILLYDSRNSVFTPSDNLLSKIVQTFGVDDDGIGIEVTLTDRMYFDGEPTGNYEEVEDEI